MTLLLQDRTLLLQFRNGERAALERVYCHYFDAVAQVARQGFRNTSGERFGALQNQADQLDFVQEVFVRAFSQNARLAYDGLRPYQPFLIRIAQNLRIDALRRASRNLVREQAAPLDPGGEHQGAENSSAGDDPLEQAEDGAHWQSLQRQVAVFVEGADKDIQQIAQLRFVDELSQAQVAERLQTTRRRVRTLEGRLLKGLRRHLQTNLAGNRKSGPFWAAPRRT